MVGIFNCCKFTAGCASERSVFDGDVNKVVLSCSWTDDVDYNKISIHCHSGSMMYYIVLELRLNIPGLLVGN